MLRSGGDLMTRTLVLGGGGATGFAWELGVLEGLRRSGIDLATADVIIGTSAGSAAGARITTGDLETAFEEQLTPPEPSVETSVVLSPAVKLKLARLMIGGDSAAKWKRAGLAARRAQDAEGPLAEGRREVIRQRVRSNTWPERDLRVTTVDGDAGEIRVLDQATGVPLLTAVTASCALPVVWPPILIDGRAHVDGGIRSTFNADLASGAERLVVLAPQTLALNRSHALHRELARAGARHTVAVTADRATGKAMGSNPLDPCKRPAAASNGLRQGMAAAAEVARVWG